MKIMERAFEVFGERGYERLATISVAHLYNLRERSGYQRHRQFWTKTRPVAIAIGERRVDSVHQGNQDGVKGLYYINAVDSRNAV
jgi:hypothetical protein